MKNESSKQALKQALRKTDVIRSAFAFDPEKECYCSLCERHFTEPP